MKKKFLGLFLVVFSCASSAMLAAMSVADAESALRSAAEHGNLKELKNFLQVPGMNVDAKDEDGETALHKAVRKGQAECVRALLVRGADDEVLDSDQGTVLHIAARKGYVVCLEELLK